MPAIRVPRLALVLPLLLAPAAGCRTSESLEPPHAPELVAATPLPITLSSHLRGWKERPATFGQKKSFYLGALLARLFPARDGRCFLSPVRAELATGWDGSRRTYEARYTFELTLLIDGASHALTAEGLGHSALDPREADRAALEDCVREIYAQVAALLARAGE